MKFLICSFLLALGLSAFAQPVITLKGKNPMYVEVGSKWISPGATAYDSIDGNLDTAILLSSDVEPGVPGIYHENYSVKNSQGQMAYATRMVIVMNDLTPPVLTLNGSDTVYIEARRDNPPFTDPGATATDTKAPFNLTSSIIVDGQVNTRRIGTYTIQYIVLDVAGNKSEATRTVIVRDTRAPEWENYQRIIYIQYRRPLQYPLTVSDAYDGDSVVINTVYASVPPLDVNRFGRYDYKYSAMDRSGNLSDTIEVSYIVRDTLAPAIQLKGSNPLNMQVYCTNPPYMDPGASVTDDISNDLDVQISGTVNTRKTGVYRITYSATDSLGNKSEVNRIVIVEDGKAPRIILPANKVQILIHSARPYYPTPQIWDDSCLSPSLNSRLEIVNSNVNPDVLGIYTETLRVSDASNNTSDEVTLLIEVVNELSITTRETKPFDLYPNPASGNFISLRFYGDNDVKPLPFTLTGIDGKSYTLPCLPGDGVYTVDVSSLAAGIYILQVEHEGKIYTEKLTRE